MHTIINPYAILGLNNNATICEIKKAYKVQALKYHPDKNGNVDEFSKIKDAYDILSNENKRKIYDECANANLMDFMNNMNNMNGDFNFNMNDLNFNMMNDLNLNHAMQGAMSSLLDFFKKNIIPKDISIKIDISINDIYRRVVKKIKVKVKRWIKEQFIFTHEIIVIKCDECYKDGEIKIIKGRGDASFIMKLDCGNIMLKINHIDISPDICFSDLLGDLDITILKKVTLYEFYTNKTFHIPELNINLENKSKISYIIEKKPEFNNYTFYINLQLKIPQYSIVKHLPNIFS